MSLIWRRSGYDFPKKIRGGSATSAASRRVISGQRGASSIAPLPLPHSSFARGAQGALARRLGTGRPDVSIRCDRQVGIAYAAGVKIAPGSAASEDRFLDPQRQLYCISCALTQCYFANAYPALQRNICSARQMAAASYYATMARNSGSNRDTACRR